MLPSHTYKKGFTRLKNLPSERVDLVRALLTEIRGKKSKKDMNFFGGFTILETIIYISILTLFSLGVITGILLMSDGIQELAASKDITNAANFSMERIIREAREATTVDFDTSVFDASPGTLDLDGTSASGSDTNVKFTLGGNGRVSIYDNSSTAAFLTPDDVNVTSLIFRHIYNASTSEAVKIEMTMQNIGGPRTITRNYYGTAVLRGSY